MVGVAHFAAFAGVISIVVANPVAYPNANANEPQIRSTSDTEAEADSVNEASFPFEGSSGVSYSSSYGKEYDPRYQTDPYNYIRVDYDPRKPDNHYEGPYDEPQHGSRPPAYPNRYDEYYDIDRLREHQHDAQQQESLEAQRDEFCRAYIQNAYCPPSPKAKLQDCRAETVTATKTVARVETVTTTETWFQVDEETPAAPAKGTKKVKRPHQNGKKCKKGKKSKKGKKAPKDDVYVLEIETILEEGIVEECTHEVQESTEQIVEHSVTQQAGEQPDVQADPVTFTKVHIGARALYPNTTSGTVTSASTTSKVKIPSGAGVRPTSEGHQRHSSTRWSNATSTVELDTKIVSPVHTTLKTKPSAKPTDKKDSAGKPFIKVHLMNKKPLKIMREKTMRDFGVILRACDIIAQDANELLVDVPHHSLQDLASRLDRQNQMREPQNAGVLSAENVIPRLRAICSQFLPAPKTTPMHLAQLEDGEVKIELERHHKSVEHALNRAAFTVEDIGYLCARPSKVNSPSTSDEEQMSRICERIAQQEVPRFKASAKYVNPGDEEMAFESSSSAVDSDLSTPTDGAQSKPHAKLYETPTKAEVKRDNVDDNKGWMLLGETRFEQESEDAPAVIWHLLDSGTVTVTYDSGRTQTALPSKISRPAVVSDPSEAGDGTLELGPAPVAEHPVISILRDVSVKFGAGQTSEHPIASAWRDAASKLSHAAEQPETVVVTVTPSVPKPRPTTVTQILTHTVTAEQLSSTRRPHSLPLVLLAGSTTTIPRNTTTIVSSSSTSDNTTATSPSSAASIAASAVASSNSSSPVSPSTASGSSSATTSNEPAIPPPRLARKQKRAVKIATLSPQVPQQAKPVPPQPESEQSSPAASEPHGETIDLDANTPLPFSALEQLRALGRTVTNERGEEFIVLDDTASTAQSEDAPLDEETILIDDADLTPELRALLEKPMRRITNSAGEEFFVPIEPADLVPSLATTVVAIAAPTPVDPVALETRVGTPAPALGSPVVRTVVVPAEPVDRAVVRRGARAESTEATPTPRGPIRNTSTMGEEQINALSEDVEREESLRLATKTGEGLQRGAR